MPKSRIYWNVSLLGSLWLGVALTLLLLVQTSRAFAVESVNPNFLLVFLVSVAAFAPRVRVLGMLGVLALGVAYLWVPFDIGVVLLAVGIGGASAALMPFLTGRSLPDAFILLLAAEIIWNFFVRRAGAPLPAQFYVAGIGLALDAACMLVVWYALQRGRARTVEV